MIEYVFVCYNGDGEEKLEMKDRINQLVIYEDVDR